MSVEITVPTLGESVSEATVAKWLKKPGEAVEVDEALVELETDKVTVEVNAPSAGVLSEVSAEEGDEVEVGAKLGTIDEDGKASEESAKQDKKEEKEPEPESEEPQKEESQEEESQESDSKDPGPAVRKLAEENDVDLSKVKGSGKDGRPTKEDVQDYIEQQGKKQGKDKDKDTGKDKDKQTSSSASSKSESSAPSASRSVSSDKKEREERVRMTRLRQRVAQRLKDAQNTAAMLTTFNEIDMSAVIDLRNQHKEAFEKKHGIKLGFMSFFVKAAVAALKDFPAVNAEIDGDEIVYKNYYDIGVAVSTPQGLMVPVVRDCDTKSFADIERDIGDYGIKARDGKISMEDLSGGTFTVSNGGVFGSLMSTPILNPPQSGILGMHKTQPRPVAIDGEIVIRPMMYVALSYDHRIIDGREAVSFLVRLKQCIEDPQRLILEV